MNVALISLGSNENRKYNVALCCRLLGDIYPCSVYSDTCITKPYGERYKHDFLNRLVIVHTEQEQTEMIRLLKSIETEMGRIPEDKQLGLVRIDIDLVVWNNEVLKPEDMKRSYIRELLPTLPQTKKISF